MPPTPFLNVPQDNSKTARLHPGVPKGAQKVSTSMVWGGLFETFSRCVAPFASILEPTQEPGHPLLNKTTFWLPSGRLKTPRWSPEVQKDGEKVQNLMVLGGLFESFSVVCYYSENCNPSVAKTMFSWSGSTLKAMIFRVFFKRGSKIPPRSTFGGLF